MSSWAHDEEVRFRERTLRILEAREHSRSELLEKLTGRGCPFELAQYLCDEMSHYGYQDDNRFGESYARTKVRAGWSKQRILCELAKRGLSGEAISQVTIRLEEEWQEEAELARAVKLASTRLLQGHTRERVARFLFRRGFGPNVVWAALKSSEATVSADQQGDAENE